MPRKRSNGEGSIFKEKSGRYRISVVKVIDGKIIRRTRTAWKMADATALLDELRGVQIIVEKKPLTVEIHILAWLKESVASEVAAGTLDSYTRAVKKHIIPRVGGLLISKFSPVDVRGWLSQMTDEEVGERTRQNAYVVLNSAMEHAVDMGLITVNPCSKNKKPSHEADPIDPFDLAEAKLILKATAGTRDHAIIQLAMTAGMRQGEIFGLHKNSIDWKNRTVKIEIQVVSVGGKLSLEKPKTKSSIRTIEVTSACLTSLKKHIAMMEREGFGESPMVFVSPGGGFVSRGNFRNRVWVPLLTTLKLNHRGPHHCRHTYATLALGAGVPVTVVSQNLGHAKASTTLDIYGHVLASHRDSATKTIEKLFS